MKKTLCTNRNAQEWQFLRNKPPLSHMLCGGSYLSWGQVAKKKLPSPSRAQSYLPEAIPTSGTENG